MLTTQDNARSLETQSQYKSSSIFTPHTTLSILFYILPINHDERIPIILKSHSKNIRYIWIHLPLELQERKVELCAMSIFMRSCHSRLYLHST